MGVQRVFRVFWRELWAFRGCFSGVSEAVSQVRPAKPRFLLPPRVFQPFPRENRTRVLETSRKSTTQPFLTIPMYGTNPH